MSYRSLCLPGFIENMLRQVEPIKSQGMFFSPASGDRKVPTCATRDIAAVAADLLLDDSWSGQDKVATLGPGDLSHNDMRRSCPTCWCDPFASSRSPARPTRPPSQHGMSEAWAQGLIDMATAVDQGIYNAEPRTPQSTTPTSLRQWCEDVLKPAVAA